LLNKDPHGKGWIVRIKMKDKADLGKLLSATDYEKYIEGLET
jgi:glycine cleavage system H protein